MKIKSRLLSDFEEMVKFQCRHIESADQFWMGKGRTMVFYYNLKTAVFQSDADFALMDGYRYQLSAPAKEAGNDVLVPVSDIGRIYSPDMNVAVDGESITLTMYGTVAKLAVGSDRLQVEFTPNKLAVPCQEIDGVVYVPVAQLIHSK